MEQVYLNSLRDILKNGDWQETRTGIDCCGLFGPQMEFDLSSGAFPLLTTKKMAWKAIVHELLWFISGDTNAGTLLKNGVNIWNEWTPAYKDGYGDLKGNEAVKAAFADYPDCNLDLDLGPVYGAQWRGFEGFDQLDWLMKRIKTNPECRRLIVSAWNPVDIPSMGLPPCHVMFQFRVVGKTLHLKMYQRSADAFLGVPFNIASYALLLKMVAYCSDLEPGRFIHTFGDYHLYSNHLEQVDEQLKREPYAPPSVEFRPGTPKDIFKITFEDIILKDYQYHPPIKAEVAV